MVLSSEKNLYEILEIQSSASAAAIKVAYRKLARKYHPDLNGGDEHCCEKFKEISEAYEILSNEEKKKNYDILRGFYRENFKTRYSEANKAYKETKSMDESQPKSVDKSDVKSHSTNPGFANIFNDILEGFKNTTSASKNKTFKTQTNPAERGTDVYTDITITILEAINGTARTLNILHTEVCPNCGGRPFINGAKCPLCNGSGEQAIHKKLTVRIPMGVKTGSKIRIPNEGNKGYNGGKNGDLYLNIKIESETKFKYSGANILSTVAITPFEAALGASIEIPTPEGKVMMKVTPNTSSGQKFRLAGQGIEQDGKKGDMIVTVNIELPQKLSEEEIRLYKELKNVSKGNIREGK